MKSHTNGDLHSQYSYWINASKFIYQFAKLKCGKTKMLTFPFQKLKKKLKCRINWLPPCISISETWSESCFRFLLLLLGDTILTSFVAIFLAVDDEADGCMMGGGSALTRVSLAWHLSLVRLAASPRDTDDNDISDRAPGSRLVVTRHKQGCKILQFCE